jgi:polysaccharide biosynthesis protein PslH
MHFQTASDLKPSSALPPDGFATLHPMHKPKNHRPLKILYLSSHWPLGKASGSQLRALHVARALQKIGEVHLATVGAEDGDAETIDKTTAAFNLIFSATLGPVGDSGLAQRLHRALDPRCEYPHGLAADARAQARLASLLPEFDLIWFFKLRTANMFAQWHWPRSIVDIDDVPSAYELSVAKTARGGERLKARFQSLVLRRREKLLAERFNVITVCSNSDRHYLGLKAPVHVIPNGFDAPPSEPHRRPTTPPRIGFIGLFDHVPNREGIAWFARECWPAIKRAVPDARLRLAGKGSEGDLNFAGPDIDRLGWMADPAAEMATWTMMIVPIRLGAGTRVKIAEAFSRNCPVVSTSLGAYGYDVADGRELCMADGAKDFSDACVNLIRDPDAAKALAANARKLFLNELTWDSIAPRVHAAAEDCLCKPNQ